jgi:mannosyltransferase OCH1-like enzyme
MVRNSKKNTKRNTKRKASKRGYNMNIWISPIPKKIHFVWIGKTPLPDYFKLFLKGFKKLNPEFEIKVWRDADITQNNFPKIWSYLQQSNELQGERIKEYTEALTMYKTNSEPYTYNKYAQMCDLIRLELIYNEGGFYFDCTFQCLKSLHTILNRKESFIGCNEVPQFKKVDFLSNSFFGATKGNPILRRLLSKRKLNNIDFRSADVAGETGPYYLRSGIKAPDDFHILDTTTLYPYIEEFAPGVDSPYRKSSKDKCHSHTKKKGYTKLKNNKGYIELPCKKYPTSYALKMWSLGRSWLIDHYYVKDGSKKRQVGGLAPCVPCIAGAASAAPAIGTAIAGACTAGVAIAYKCVKKLTKNKKNKKNKKKK